MVDGLDIFKEHFAAYADRYVLIGGTASSIAMDELGVDFRVTKDLDIVLIVEALDREFVEAFWQFVELGQYENWQKSTGKRLFYRFHSPHDKRFPFMLELFSRKLDALDLVGNSGLTPIPTEDEVSSLSAILMDDDYYAFVLNQRRDINGLSYIGAEALIPLKAKAYVDLSARKAAGETVNSKDIKKHKNDVFRLFGILETDQAIDISESIQRDLADAFSRLSEDTVDLKALNIKGKSQLEVLRELGVFYGIQPF
jgi:hypothetical protein